MILAEGQLVLPAVSHTLLASGQKGKQRLSLEAELRETVEKPGTAGQKENEFVFPISLTKVLKESMASEEK